MEIDRSFRFKSDLRRTLPGRIVIYPSAGRGRLGGLSEFVERVGHFRFADVAYHFNNVSPPPLEGLGW